MAMRVLEASKRLERDSIKSAVLHVPTIRPPDMEAVRSKAEWAGRLVVAVKSDTVVEGLGEAVATELMRGGTLPGFRQIALPDGIPDAGSLPTLHDRCGLTVHAVEDRNKAWMGD